MAIIIGQLNNKTTKDMKRLVIFGEPLLLNREQKFVFEEMHRDMPVSLFWATHLFKAIVVDGETKRCGYAVHTKGLGGTMTFLEDPDVSFVGVNINHDATSWWTRCFTDTVLKTYRHFKIYSVCN